MDGARFCAAIEMFKRHKVTELNDAFRKNPSRGRIIPSRGVALCGQEFLEKALKAVAEFNRFTIFNDPDRDHAGSM